jgi:hypothetical protein
MQVPRSDQGDSTINRTQHHIILAAVPTAFTAAASAADALRWERTETSLTLRDGQRVVWRFTEHYLSGVLASLVPLGRVVEYDRVNRKVVNLPELNQYITRKYRKGYEIV